ncbi:uncharacterized protein LOC111890055 [Lactuca sativa]|uniref:uncharacterized protein LOC111890055 n=1 Tax=Lactuca sativa TaxID=4236 RepID=UPI000CD811AF|nr:uncharacterized protein LOC111890055 [Lactuca sativa]
MARKSKSPTPPDSDNDGADVEESHQESPRGNTPPRSPTPTESPSHKQPTPTPSPKPKVTVSVVLTSTSISTPPVISVSIPTTTFTSTISQTPHVSSTLFLQYLYLLSLPKPPLLHFLNRQWSSTYLIRGQLLTPNLLSSLNRFLQPTQPVPSIREKVDQLLEDNKAYGGLVLKAFVETPIEQYTTDMDKSTNAIKESASTCRKASADVAEVIQTTQIFLDSLKEHADTNAAKIHESVESLSNSLQEE